MLGALSSGKYGMRKGWHKHVAVCQARHKAFEQRGGPKSLCVTSPRTRARKVYATELGREGGPWESLCVVVSRGRGTGVGVGGKRAGGMSLSFTRRSLTVKVARRTLRVVHQVSLASSLPSMGLWLGRMSGFRENKMPRTSSLSGLS